MLGIEPGKPVVCLRLRLLGPGGEAREGKGGQTAVIGNVLTGREGRCPRPRLKSGHPLPFCSTWTASFLAGVHVLVIGSFHSAYQQMLPLQTYPRLFR